MAASKIPLLPLAWARSWIIAPILGTPWATDQPLLELCIAVGLGEREMIRKQVRHRQLSYLWHPAPKLNVSVLRDHRLYVDWAESTYAELLRQPVISFRPITSYDLEVSSGLGPGIVIFVAPEKMVRAVLAGEPHV